MNRYIATVICVLCAGYCAAQSSMTGQVMDAYSREPLPGVSIVEMSGHEGTVTGMNGAFRLTLSRPSDSILVTYTGYEPVRMVATADTAILLKPSTTSLNELVVSASRQAQQRTEAPVAIGVISPEMIRETHPVTLDQVLNKVSGVYMVDLGNEQHTMAIRQPIGYRSNFLYLEDGIPIRTIGDFNHNALIEINQAAVRRIEVVKGPSSSLYGSDAVGGAVNFITKSPSLTPDAHVSVEGSSWGYRRAQMTASNTFHQTGVLLSGYYADQHGGYMDHDDFHKLALTARVTRQLGSRMQLAGTVTDIDYYTDQNGGLDSAHFFGKDYQSFYTFNYRKVHALRATVSWTGDWSPRQSSTVSLYYRHNRIGQNPAYRIKSTPAAASGEVNNDYFQSWGLFAQDNWKLAPWNTRLIVGAHAEISPAGYRANFIDVRRNQEGYFTGYTATDSLLTDYRADLVNAAGYLQLQTSPVRSLRLVAGLRYDLLEYRFNNLLTPSAYTGAPDGVNNFRQLTPKVGLTYDFGSDRGAYANYSVGFAPPDMGDLYTGVAIPYLEPARYFNYEVGGWWSFDHQRGYADLSLYRMTGTGEIISVRAADGSSYNRNAGRTLHYGVEYTVNYKPASWLKIRLSGTSARHRFVRYVENGKNYDGNQMNGAPHRIINSEVSYSPAFLAGLTASVEWQYLSGYYMDPENTLRYPGYQVFNIRVRYERKAFEVWANLLNAGNKVYATSAEKTAYSTAYRPGALRTLYLGVSYHFTGRKGKESPRVP